MKQQLVFKKLTMEMELMEVNPDDIELSVLKGQVRLLLRNPCVKWCIVIKKLKMARKKGS
jgi:hypothetical protein